MHTRYEQLPRPAPTNGAQQDTGSVHCLGNGRLCAYGQGPDLIQVFGPPYSAPSLGRIRLEAPDAVTVTSGREPGCAIWTHSVYAGDSTNAAPMATITDFVDAELPCLVRWIRTALPLQMIVEADPLARRVASGPGLASGTAPAGCLFELPPGQCFYHTYPMPFPTFYQLAWQGALTRQADGPSGTIRLACSVGEAVLLLAGGPQYPAAVQTMEAALQMGAARLLERTRCAWRAQTARRTVPAFPEHLPQRALLTQALDDVTVMIKAQQGHEGGVLAGYNYHLAYVRDQYGVARGLLKAGLHDLLQASPYSAGQFEVSNVRLGDGGWMGNRQGASFWIDNLTLGPCVSAVGEGVALNWTATDPGGIAGYSYHWSPAAHEAPATTAAIEAPGARFRGLPEGRQFFHIRAADGAGNWGETADWPFLIDNTPPRVRRVFPAADSAAVARVTGVELDDPIAGIDPTSLTLAVNGRAFAPGQPGVEIDLAAGRFAVDWVTVGVLPTPPPEGQVFTVVLGPVKDFAGNLSAPTTWSWRYTAKGDQQAPLAPLITWPNGPVAQQITMEPEPAVLSAAPPVWLERVPDPALGTHVQRVRLGGGGVDLRVALPGSIDAATHRWFSFRYRFPPHLKIDLAGTVADPDPEKQQMVIKLTDAEVRPDYVTHAGRVAGIRCDDRWHTAVVDLKTHVEQREHLKPDETPKTYAIGALSFADVGFNRQDPGTVFYLDDLLVTAPGPAAVSFGLAAADESGIAGFACSFDRDADGAPPPEVTVKPGSGYAVTFPDKGLWYVHARAQDGAGNWSQVAHFPYVVE